METEWGQVLTIGIQPLVELKKTQRLEDYSVISKLAIAWFDQLEFAGTDADLVWALQNIFTLSELAMVFTEHSAATEIAGKRFNRAVSEFGQQLSAGETTETVEHCVGEFFQSRIAELQSADRQYWRKIISELKELRAAGKLKPEGETVSAMI